MIKYGHAHPRRYTKVVTLLLGKRKYQVRQRCWPIYETTNDAIIASQNEGEFQKGGQEGNFNLAC